MASVSETWIDANDPRLQNLRNDNVRWWMAFNDPTLDQLMVAASQQNLSLRVAGARILEARAQRGIANGNLFPQQQGAFGLYSRNALGNIYPLNEFPGLGHYFDNSVVGFNATWELDFWGRFRRSIEAADANLDANVAGFDNVLVLLQAEVAANYIQMRAFEERIELAKKNIELQKETLRIIDMRARAGLVTELDVQQATANLAATEALIPMLSAGHRRTQIRLCILMGEPPHELSAAVHSPGVIPAPPPDVVLGIPAELLRRRPDVRLAERKAAAQCAQIGIAEAEFYPHIGITGVIGYDSEQFNHLFEPRSVIGAVGPGFQWNILNYGRLKNNVAAKQAKFEQAVLEYQDTVLEANADVENSVTAFLREQDRAQFLNICTQAASRSVDIAMKQYEKGLIDYQPLLDSQRVLVHQQDIQAESRGLIGVYLVGVYKSLGGGWQARLEPVSPTSPMSPTVVPIPVPLDGPVLAQ
jgi:NodT family efflux transporter outer membrane factor (OMF) lipoprotein